MTICLRTYSYGCTCYERVYGPDGGPNFCVLKHLAFNGPPNASYIRLSNGVTHGGLHTHAQSRSVLVFLRQKALSEKQQRGTGFRTQSIGWLSTFVQCFTDTKRGPFPIVKTMSGSYPDSLFDLKRTTLQTRKNLMYIPRHTIYMRDSLCQVFPLTFRIRRPARNSRQCRSTSGSIGGA